MGISRGLCALAAACLFSASTVYAVPVVDQQHATTDDPANSTGVGIVTFGLAQTFTVGITGTLTGVEFHGLKFDNTTGDLTVDIRTTTSGAPQVSTGSALGTATVANALIAAYSPANATAFSTLFVDFSAANIQVTAGDVLSFVLTSPIGQEFSIQTDYLDAYAGGSRWSQTSDGNAFDELASADLTFRTFVDSANRVPEPGGLALFALSLVALHALRRRRG